MMLRLRVLEGPLKLLVAFLCQGEGKSARGMCTNLRLQLQLNVIAIGNVFAIAELCGIHVLIEMQLSVFVPFERGTGMAHSRGHCTGSLFCQTRHGRSSASLANRCQRDLAKLKVCQPRLELIQANNDYWTP